MKRKIVVLLTLVMALSMIVSPAFAFPLDAPVESTAQPPATASRAAPLVQTAEAAGPARYFVILSDPAVPNYTGDIAGYEATNPASKGQTSFNAESPASRAYASYLEAQQAALVADAAQMLGRQPEVVYQLQFALNAVVMVLNPDEAEKIASLPGVAQVERDTIEKLDTDVGPQWIGAPGIWDGTATGSLPGTKGEGVIIGVIDSGINMDHPSFADVGGDGFNHTNPFGAGNFKGWCNPANPNYSPAYVCNDKLVGAWDYADASSGETDGPEDDNGHGSHTASTSGGNYLAPGTVVLGSYPYSPAISGVAPHANIIAYDVCGTSCFNTDVVAALNQVILDDVNVTNESIGISGNTWTGAKQAAYLSVFNAGITAARSAGNSGPGASTVAKTGPWNAAVAASTINRVIANTVDVTGPTTPAALQGMAAVPGENTSIVANVTGPIKYNAANSDGCVAFSAGYFTNSLALIQRGGCTFAIKVNNAAAAGAIGVIIFNNVGGPPSAWAT
jgi:hypothetical protein